MSIEENKELSIEEILEYITSIIAMVRQALMLPHNAIRLELLRTLHTQMAMAILGLQKAIERDEEVCKES